MANPDLDELFHQCVALDSTRRAAFLAALRPDVREQLEALLQADASVAAKGRLDPSGHRVEDLPKPASIKPEDNTTLVPPPDDALIPDQIGPYKILQQIGEGGMGQVYMAEQLQPVRRRVALKIIRSEAPTREILARFEAERQALAMMDHQNIARVLDAGITEDGRPYFAMELVKGVPIIEFCDQNRLSPEERLKLFVQTCRAIQHAHQKGIIHRDLKPTNVLVTLYDGTPVAKVIDFGLAKAVHSTSQLTQRTLFTQFGQVVGTLAYMSPEQAELNALDVDTRTDVYSLGVILYELLTGSTPLSRDRIRTEAFDQILRLIREEEPPRLSTRLSESGDAITGISQQRQTDPRRLSLLLKGDLDWIAMKALEKSRTRRYDGAAALADDVERYLDDEPIIARPPSLGYRLQKSFRKHRAGFVTAGSVLCLLILGLAGTGIMWWKADRAEEEARAEARKAILAETATREEMTLRNEAVKQAVAAQRKEADARAEADSARRELEASLARSDFLLAVSRRENHQIAETEKLLDGIPADHRHLEWNLLRSLTDGSDLRCYGHSGAVRNVDFRPDGEQFLSQADDGIRVWSATDGELQFVLDRSAGLGAKYTADNRLIFTYRETQLEFRHADTGEISHVVELSDAFDEEMRIWSAVMGPADDMVVVSLKDGTVGVWDLPSGANRWIREVHTERPTFMDAEPCFSPDGRLLVCSGHTYSDSRRPGHLVKPRADIMVLDVTTGDQIQTLSFTEEAYPRNLRFSPDGDFLAWSGILGKTSIVDVLNWSRCATIDLTYGSNTGSAYDLAFSPDSTMLAAAAEDNTIRVWDMISVRGKLLQSLSSIPDSIEPSGLLALAGHTDEVNAICFSPDGRRLLSGGDDKTVRLWNLRSYSPVRSGDRLRRIPKSDADTVTRTSQADSFTIRRTGDHQLEIQQPILNHSRFRRMRRSPHTQCLMIGPEL